MDELIEQMLKLHALGAHFMDMAFIRDAVEPSVVEAIAMQGLSAAALAAQAAGYNMAGKAGP